MALTFKPIENVRNWFCGILPLVYDNSLSYYEQISKFTDKLNEVIDQTNEIGESVASIAGGGKDYYINVTNPGGAYTPLVGDGNTDNTEAFQALANIENAVLFFPAGIYATKSVTCKCDIVGAGAMDSQILCLNDNTTNAGVIMTNNANIYSIGINGNKGGQSEEKHCLALTDSNMAVGVRCYNGSNGIAVTSDNCEFLGQIERCTLSGNISGKHNIVIATEDTNSLTDNGNSNILITNYLFKSGVSSFIVNSDIVNVTADNVSFDCNSAFSVTGNDFVVDSKNPITYREPSKTYTFFDSVPIKHGNNIYNLLVGNDKTSNLTDIKNYINVTEYGAKGDGVTDDSNAITKALAHLGDDNSTIYFPAGTYLISHNLRVYSNTKIIFDLNAVLKMDIDSFEISYEPSFCLGEYNNSTFATGYDGVHDVIFENVNIDGGYDDRQETSYGPGVVAMSHTNNVKFINCTFKNGYNNHYVDIGGCKNTLFSGCYFDGHGNVGNNNYEAINIDNATQNGFPNYGSWDNTVTNGLTITNCVFDSYTNKYALGNHTSTNNYSLYIVVNSNIFMNCSGAIHLYQIRDIVISDNIFFGCGGNGVIAVNQVNGVDISSNTFRDCTTSCINLLPSSTSANGDISIVGNKANGITGSFLLTTNCGAISCCGNVMRNLTEAGLNATGGYLIFNGNFLNSCGSSSNVAISVTKPTGYTSIMDNCTRGVNVISITGSQNVAHRNNAETTITIS